MKNPVVFFGAIVVAVISLVLAIYYAIPNVHHVLTSGAVPAQDPQPTHVVLFAVICVICIIAALVTRPKARAR
ncbi:MAG: hypothetical protein WCD86_27680 [Ktedonobacteraceae bacterium]|nr:hypothetical protein [Ktedonobacteraceae bacterium]